MTFAQLTHRESLCDIEVACAPRRTSCTTGVSGATFPEAPWPTRMNAEIGVSYVDLAQALIRTARPCILTTWFMRSMPLPSTCAYPSFRGHCFAQPNLPSSFRPRSTFKATSQPLSTSPTASYTTSMSLDLLIPEHGAFYIMDRGYVDFERLFTLHRTGRFFVIRAKSNTKYRRRYSHPGDESGGVRCDRTIALSGIKSVRDYPPAITSYPLPRCSDQQDVQLLDQQLRHSSADGADLYRYRWQVELLSRWIKQHLHIKSFFGTSENAVKSQIWIAISVYILVAIIKNHLDSNSDLYTILQILSLASLEKNSSSSPPTRKLGWQTDSAGVWVTANRSSSGSNNVLRSSTTTASWTG